MIYQIGNMALNCIREVFKGPANDVVICRDDNAPLEVDYTLLVVKNHEIAKAILQDYEKAGRKLFATATYMNNFLFVFPYTVERPLNDFYMGEAYDVNTCELVCTNLVTECIASEIPYPLLYMILSQGQINMDHDYNIYFGYEVDLTGYDSRRGERECAVNCAGTVLRLLEPKASRKVMSYQLLERKVPRESYQRFTDLYKDVRMASEAEKKKGLFARIKAWITRNADGLFRFFLIICIALAVITIVMLLSQLLFGDIPFLRLFFNSFKQIGTESMLQ